MSYAPDYNANCRGKVAFKSLKDANRAAGRKKERRRAYLCQSCGDYHVGSFLRESKFKKPSPVQHFSLAD